MARPNFDAMVTEVTRRLGGINYTNADSRIREWVTASYFEIALRWHHHELDEIDVTQTLGEGDNAISVPSACHILTGVGFNDPGASTFKKWVTPRDIHIIQATFSEAKAEPSHYARFGDEIFFNSHSDASYPVKLLFYRKPDEPVYTTDTTTSELGVEWDELIEEYATALGYFASWRPDLGGALLGRIMEVAQALPNEPIMSGLLPDRPSIGKADTTHGGEKT